MSIHPPKVKSFLIADQVFQQAGGKWCVIGAFSHVNAPFYPIKLVSIGLYICISDAEGDYRVKVEFRNASDEVLAVLPELQVRAKDRLAAPDFGIQSYNLPIPAPGKYFFKLHFNDVANPEDIQIEAKVPGGSP